MQLKIHKISVESYSISFVTVRLARDPLRTVLNMSSPIVHKLHSKTYCLAGGHGTSVGTHHSLQEIHGRGASLALTVSRSFCDSLTVTHQYTKDLFGDNVMLL